MLRLSLWIFSRIRHHVLIDRYVNFYSALLETKTKLECVKNKAASVNSVIRSKFPRESIFRSRAVKYSSGFAIPPVDAHLVNNLIDKKKLKQTESHNRSTISTINSGPIRSINFEIN